MKLEAARLVFSMAGVPESIRAFLAAETRFDRIHIKCLTCGLYGYVNQRSHCRTCFEQDSCPECFDYGVNKAKDLAKTHRHFCSKKQWVAPHPQWPISIIRLVNDANTFVTQVHHGKIRHTYKSNNVMGTSEKAKSVYDSTSKAFSAHRQSVDVHKLLGYRVLGGEPAWDFKRASANYARLP